MRSGSRRRFARRLGAGLLALLASTAYLSPANAYEGRSEWFDFISDLLKRPEGVPVDVPLRKQDQSEPPPSVDSSAPQEALETDQEQTSPPSPPAEIPEPLENAEMPERLERAELSHVYRAVQDVIAEIHILREELGARDFPPETELLEDRAPVHVYVKTLEVLAKVTQIQRRLGIPAGRVVRIPFKEIDAADILVNVEYMRNEVERIKTQTGVQREIVPATLESATTPSLIYQSLADASFLLDTLRGQPLAPVDVYRHLLSVLDEAALIAEKLKVAVELDPPPVKGRKKSIDVAQQLLRATYKVISLQTRLHMDTSRVPTMSLVRVSPSECYDMTNLLLAELVRIKQHLGIDKVRRDRTEQPSGQEFEDVFALVQLMIRNLDRLSEAVAD